jgi:hypothetical protein
MCQHTNSTQNQGVAMKNIIVLLSLFAFAVTSFIGCSQRIGDFTLISTKNVDIGGNYKKLNDRFEGEDSRGEILAIPLGIPNLKTAVDNCIEAGDGELLTNAVIDFSYWTVIFYGERKYTVTGDVWVKASTSDLLNPSEEIFELKTNSHGFQLVSLTEPTKVIKVDYFVSGN